MTTASKFTKLLFTISTLTFHSLHAVQSLGLDVRLEDSSNTNQKRTLEEFSTSAELMRNEPRDSPFIQPIPPFGLAPQFVHGFEPPPDFGSNFLMGPSSFPGPPSELPENFKSKAPSSLPQPPAISPNFKSSPPAQKTSYGAAPKPQTHSQKPTTPTLYVKEASNYGSSPTAPPISYQKPKPAVPYNSPPVIIPKPKNTGGGYDNPPNPSYGPKPVVARGRPPGTFPRQPGSPNTQGAVTALGLQGKAPPPVPKTPVVIAPPKAVAAVVPIAACQLFAAIQGTCKFNPKEFIRIPKCGLAFAIPFRRLTGITCEQCLKECTRLQNVISSPKCKSATYDYRWFVCDLFAITGQNIPQSSFNQKLQGFDLRTNNATVTPRPTLGVYAGRDYYQYIGTGVPATVTTTTSTTSTTTTTTAPPPLCPSGQVPLFPKIKNTALVSTSALSSNPATSDSACQNACKSIGGYCKGFYFKETANECSIINAPEDKPALKAADVKAEQKTNYFPKYCITGSTSKFEIEVGMKMRGQLSTLESASGLKECLEKCIKAGTGCLSINFVPSLTGSNCGLLTIRRNQDPLSYTPDPIAWFVEKSTTKTSVVFRDITSRVNKSANADKSPIPLKTWVSSLTSNCLAIRNYRGDKLCPHGLKLNPLGKKKYCSNPIDC